MRGRVGIAQVAVVPQLQHRLGVEQREGGQPVQLLLQRVRSVMSRTSRPGAGHGLAGQAGARRGLGGVQAGLPARLQTVLIRPPMS